MSQEILIIGGGISGVTTGIVLQLLGHSTRIMCRHWLGASDAAGKPYANEARFASQYPAASIIPHSVTIADEAWHIRTNLRFFEVLHFAGTSGMRKQRHYEIFESTAPVASYAPAMPGYRALPNDGSGEPGAPRRSSGVPIYGWSFQALFAEMTRYRTFLSHLYLALGGEVKPGGFCDPAALAREKVAAIVNCGGAWAASLFGDTISSRFVKGFLLCADSGGRISWNRATGEVFSYNYHPAPDIYPRPDSSPADVYFYPRTDGWLLGGTRLASVELNALEWEPEAPWPWRGEIWDGPTIPIPCHGGPGLTLPVPAPIVAVNREILQKLTSYDPSNFPLTAMVGYRHQRVPVRVEREDNGEVPVIHNYGHGGAGVTISWSCAIQAASLTVARDPVCVEEIELLLAKALQP